MQDTSASSQRNHRQEELERQTKKVKIDQGIHKVFHDQGKEKAEDEEDTSPNRREEQKRSTPADVAHATKTTKVTTTKSVEGHATNNKGVQQIALVLFLLLGAALVIFFLLDLREKWSSVEVLSDDSVKKASIAITVPDTAKSPGGQFVPNARLFLVAGQVVNMHEGLGIIVGYAKPAESAASNRTRTVTEFFPCSVVQPRSNGNFQVSEMPLPTQGIFDLYLFLVERSIWMPMVKFNMSGEIHPLPQLPPSIAQQRMRLKIGSGPTS